MKIKRIYLDSACDRCGKTTLKQSLEKATNFRYHIVDRSTISNRTYDYRYGRLENDTKNYDVLEDLDKDYSIVVFMEANSQEIQKRIEDTGHEQIDIEKDVEASKWALSRTHYKNIIHLDSTHLTIQQEVEKVLNYIKRLEEEK